jgi:hypothetical protein
MNGRCNRCGRVLKNPVYVEIGYGKVCAAKEGVTVPKHEKKNVDKPVEKEN